MIFFPRERYACLSFMFAAHCYVPLIGWTHHITPLFQNHTCGANNDLHYKMIPMEFVLKLHGQWNNTPSLIEWVIIKWQVFPLDILRTSTECGSRASQSGQSGLCEEPLPHLHAQVLLWWAGSHNQQIALQSFRLLLLEPGEAFPVDLSKLYGHCSPAMHLHTHRWVTQNWALKEPHC